MLAGWSVVLASACGTNVDLGGHGATTDGGGAGSDGALTCPGYAAPNEHAVCKGCSYDCQPNGCFGGWYCRIATQDCQAPCKACGLPRGDCEE